jgi:hypothetical protein
MTQGRTRKETFAMGEDLLETLASRPGFSIEVHPGKHGDFEVSGRAHHAASPCRAWGGQSYSLVRLGRGAPTGAGWLPQAETFILKGATHGLQIIDPKGMAEGLAGFFARHPLPKRS